MALGDIKGELIADINKETKKGIFTDKYTWATSIEDDFLDIALCNVSSNFQAIKIVYPNQNLSYSELNYIIDKSMIFPIFITNTFFNFHKTQNKLSYSKFIRNLIFQDFQYHNH